MKAMANLRASGRKRSGLESVKEEFASSVLLNTSVSGKRPDKAVSSSLPSVPSLLTSNGHRGPEKKKGKKRPMDWHKEVLLANQSGRWDHLKGALSVYSTDDANGTSSPKRKKSFWKRIQKAKDETPSQSLEQNSLLVVDSEGRTPLHAALACRKTPVDVLVSMIRAAPGACQIRTEKQRYPLHFAVLGRHHIQVIAELVENFPEALSALDGKRKSPLAYAFDMAKKSTNLEKAPKTFWMTTDSAAEGISGNSAHSKGSSLNEGHSSSSLSRRHKRSSKAGDQQQAWQEEQSKVWGVVRWLLLSLATNAQTHLFVGDHQKPMLVDALLYAAPPSVISLLIGASVRLLSTDHTHNRATAFAGSTLYSCLTRHYPLNILQSLANQCPKDVRTVRDETGMGLVSAHFISGCFQQSRMGEWKMNSLFVDTLLEATETQLLPTDNTGFCEWWMKMEYLIYFCGSDERDYAILSQSQEYLLHAALVNPDVPPSIVRLLLALYPSSIHLAHPLSGALPIHIAASCPDYIPRNYEFQMMGSEVTTLAVVVGADPSAVVKRHEGRLPLHLALDVGKHFQSVHALLQDDSTGLISRDPVSGLFPFMLASSYQVRSSDEFRFSCLARNKYTHAVWKGLNEKQKATATLRVADADTLERTDSVYRLLRIHPSAIRKRKRKSLALDHPGSIVRRHFLSWCFDELGDEVWSPNAARIHILQQVLQEAKEMQSLDNFQNGNAQGFFRWWHKMKFWIRYCVPLDALDAYKDIPLRDTDEYLLHAAIANAKNTPPQVVELLLNLYPNSAQLLVPDHSLLPLHIACLAEPYLALPFENPGSSAVELVLKAYPAAANIPSDNGQLPLHIAISSRKSPATLVVLALESPSSLKTRDAGSRLYPFQMVASQPERSAEQNQQLQDSTASFNFVTCDWDELPTRSRAINVRKVQMVIDKLQLNCIFELLRKGASVIRETNSGLQGQVSAITTNLKGQETGISEEHLETVSDGHLGSIKYADSSNSSSEDEDSPDEDEIDGAENDVDEDDAEGSDDSDDNQNTMFGRNMTKGRAKPFSSTSQPSSLMRLLSRESSKPSDVTGDVFECDHSVFSGVDVMSTISKSYHSRSKKNKSQPRPQYSGEKRPLPDSEEISLQMSELGRPEAASIKYNDSEDESIVVDESAGDVDRQGLYESISIYGDDLHRKDASDDSSSEFMVDSDSDVEGSDSEDSDFEGLIYFQMRRPKSRLRGSQGVDEPIKDVKLTKKDDPLPNEPGGRRSLPANRMPSRADSLRHMLISSEREVNDERDALEKIGELADDDDVSEVPDVSTSGVPTSPRSKSKIYEQASILRSHGSKDFDTEDLGKTFASMRMAAATKPKRASQNISRSASERQSGNSQTLETLLDSVSQSPSKSDNKPVQAMCPGRVSQAPLNLLPSTMARNFGSVSSDMTGSVSTIQLLEYSRSNDDSEHRDGAFIYDQVDNRPTLSQYDSESSSDASVSGLMAQSVRSHMRDTGHGPEGVEEDDSSRTVNTFSESAQSFFDESTSSGCNHTDRTSADVVALETLSEDTELVYEMSEATVARKMQSNGLSSQVEKSPSSPLDEAESAAGASNTRPESNESDSDISTQCEPEDDGYDDRETNSESDESDGDISTTGHESQAASFDRRSFKWVNPVDGQDVQALTAAHNSGSEHPEILEQLEGGLKPAATSFAETSRAAPRKRGSYNAFNSLKQAVGLPKAQTDAASWLRDHMASERSGMACLLCSQRQREVLMVPCHHLSLCISCSTDNPGIPCPLCNIAVTGRIEIKL